MTIGPLVLFSTAGGDAWLLDPADHLATRIAQDGDPLPVHIEETKPCVAQRDAGRGRHQFFQADGHGSRTTRGPA